MAKVVNSGQNITTNDLTVPFRIVSNASASVGIWGGNGGSGPAHDPLNVNAGVYGDSTGSTNNVGVLASLTMTTALCLSQIRPCHIASTSLTTALRLTVAAQALPMLLWLVVI